VSLTTAFATVLVECADGAFLATESLLNQLIDCVIVLGASVLMASLP